ncbi:hypothetical protein PR048_013369 [Dryococelus australis]|uniref:Uncharacterized protein n=1 Tax=Dryococelus australis TaxID=614101 RepID=A0ABQ9HSS9_9NEOP|nr:hypothetical protein PR048_013369 [Dryococelus australis]
MVIQVEYSENYSLVSQDEVHSAHLPKFKSTNIHLLLVFAKVLYVPERDVQDTSLFLNKRWESVKEIPGIRNYHHFEIYYDEHILASFTHNSEKRKKKVKVKVKQSTPQEVWLQFEDVYSDSDTENDTNEQDGDRIDISQDQEIKRLVDPQCFIPVTFIIVTIHGEGPKHSLSHNCVAVYQTGIHIAVISCLPYGRSWSDVAQKSWKSRNVTDEDDQTDINIAQISSVLPTLNVKTIGSKLIYKYQNHIQL